MLVSELMTRDVKTASPDDSLKDVSDVMARLDTGFVPVGDNDRLVGTITDRDIAIRGVASGQGPEAKVGDVMTPDVKYCFEDDDVEEVSQNMADIQMRRLPVVSRDKRLVGVIALGDIATNASSGDEAEVALTGISR